MDDMGCWDIDLGSSELVFLAWKARSDLSWFNFGTDLLWPFTIFVQLDLECAKYKSNWYINLLVDNDDNDDDQYTNNDNDDDQYNGGDQYREPMNNRETVKLGDKVLTWIMASLVIKSFAKLVLK